MSLALRRFVLVSGTCLPPGDPSDHLVAHSCSHRMFNPEQFRDDLEKGILIVLATLSSQPGLLSWGSGLQGEAQGISHGQRRIVHVVLGVVRNFDESAFRRRPQQAACPRTFCTIALGHRLGVGSSVSHIALNAFIPEALITQHLKEGGTA